MDQCKFYGITKLMGEQIYKYYQYYYRKYQHQDIFNTRCPVFQDNPCCKTGKGDCGKIAEPVVFHCNIAENEMCLYQ